MRKQANLSRVTYTSIMIVALYFVQSADTMVDRDAAALKAVSQAWRLDWNGTDECSNYGVRCDEVGNAIFLSLNNNNLTGNIPASLGELQSLRVIFGVVLLEMVTCATRFNLYSLGDGPDVLYSVQEAAWIVCTTRPDWLPHMLDPDLEEVPPEDAFTMLRIAIHCISRERRDRPKMERVVAYLKGEIEVPFLPIQRPSWLRDGMDESLPAASRSKITQSGHLTSPEISAGQDRKSERQLSVPIE